MNHLKRINIDVEMQSALDSLHSLIVQTNAAIMRCKDPSALSKLIFDQRHNLKVLFRQLEREKK